MSTLSSFVWLGNKTNEWTNSVVLCKKCNEPVDSLEVDARATDDVPFGQIWQTVDYAPWHFRRLAQIATGTGGIAPCIPPCVHFFLSSLLSVKMGVTLTFLLKQQSLTWWHVDWLLYSFFFQEAPLIPFVLSLSFVFIQYHRVWVCSLYLFLNLVIVSLECFFFHKSDLRNVAGVGYKESVCVCVWVLGISRTSLSGTVQRETQSRLRLGSFLIIR